MKITAPSPYRFFTGFLLFACSLFSVLAKGQNIKEDIAKINAAYEKQQNLHINMVYNLYQNFSTKYVYQTENGEVYKKGTEQLYKIATIEVLTNNKYTISVNSTSKTIMVTKPQDVKKQIVPLNLDTALKLFKSVEYIPSLNGTSGYHFRLDYGEYEQIDVYYNSSTYFIEKIVLYQREAVKLDVKSKSTEKEKPRLEILYHNQVLTKPDAKIFSEKNFLSFTSKGMQCAPAYKSYTLVNYLKAKTKI